MMIHSNKKYGFSFYFRQFERLKYKSVIRDQAKSMDKRKRSSVLFGFKNLQSFY